MRLDKLISKSLGVTRREARALIASGAVKVNDKLVKNAAFKVDPSLDRIEVKGEPIQYEEKIYLVLNKPKGYLSTTEEDADYPSFLELIPEYAHRKPFAAGRLDVDASGLLLVTDDGELAHRITHPKWKVPKTYEVLLEKPLSADQIEKIKRGPLLEGKPAGVKDLKANEGDYAARITVTEGRHHLVKRIFAAVGNRVLELKRTAVGPLELGDLEEGYWRALTPEEVKKLKEAVKLT